MATNQEKFDQMYDRIMGGIPGGAARDPKQTGGVPVRLADSGDIYDIKERLKAVLDTSGGNVILKTIREATAATAAAASAGAGVDAGKIADEAYNAFIAKLEGTTLTIGKE